MNIRPKIVGLASFAGLVACADTGANCRHDVCDIRDQACVEFVAEVVACQRDVPMVLPPVRFVTQAELIAEREPPTEAQLEFERNYWAGEALVGLMPQNYDPANTASNSLSRVLGFYRIGENDITIVEDADIDDDQAAYRLLVHEMIHAYQDAEYDLDTLWGEYATTVPRDLGFRAVVEGEAVLFTNLADLEIEGIAESEIDWDRYFAEWQNAMLERAQDTEVPSLAVWGLFPYAFGGEQVYEAWRQGGLEAVRDYVTNPPDSVRQVMAGYGRRPPDVFNLDTRLDPRAVPVLQGHIYLSGGAQDAWLLNTMAQRIAGHGSLWTPNIDEIEADHLSVWQNETTGNRVAIWRLMASNVELDAVLVHPGSQWTTLRDEATTHFMQPVGDDWVLVASEAPDAVEIADAITGWESRAEALERSELVRAPSTDRLVLREDLLSRPLYLRTP